MSNAAEKLMSLEAFLAWEREQPERYEYAGGVITMMTGGSVAHVTIAPEPRRSAQAGTPRYRVPSVWQ